MPRPQILPPAAVAELYQSGKSCQTIGRQYGVTPAAVMRCLRKTNTPLRSKQQAYAAAHKPASLPICPCCGQEVLPSRAIALPDAKPCPKLPPSLADLPVFTPPSEQPLPDFLRSYKNSIPLQMCPPVVATVSKLAVLVLDQDEWDVESIQKRFSVSHAVAVKYLRYGLSQLSADVQPLCLWKDELMLPGLVTMIKHKAQMNNRICAARDCAVTKVEPAAAKAFYETHHLQGSCNSRDTIGLTFEDRLVACMSFNRSDTCRGKIRGHLLQRFAAVGHVPGAASKLLSAFRAGAAGAVISYSDERYAPGGNLYKVLGFSEVAYHKPDYRYWKDGRWFAKSSKQRYDLVRELSEAGQAALPEDTEYTMASRLGYKRCYDAGKRTWLLQ